MIIPGSRFLIALGTVAFIIVAFCSPLAGQDPGRSLKVNLYGVYESKITIMALSPSGRFSPFIETEPYQPGDDIILSIPSAYLPGEFVVRFDYRIRPTDDPYPAEKTVLIGYQDVELSVSPPFSNNPDSTYFQPGELENAAWAEFSAANAARKEKLGVLQYFLMNYDDTESKFFNQGLEEYEKRRKEYNQWLAESANRYKGLFIRSRIGFEYVPEVNLSGSEEERLFSLIHHYFDGIDFNDTLIIRNSLINQWMDAYVNLHGQMVTTVALRDSLFPAAGIFAIDKAKFGHPKVYGWMVDYFYRGYEANGIDAGIKVLEPYLNDPNCLTSKRLEITRRLEGLKTLVPGSRAPDIELKTEQHVSFVMSEFNPVSDYILVVFWSADCNHCMELINKLYPWHQQAGRKEKVSVVAVSLDETETEIAAWRQVVPSMPAWTHLNAPEGVNSKAAHDYYVLATPMMFLLSSSSKEIVALPGSLNELEAAIQ